MIEIVFFSLFWIIETAFHGLFLFAYFQLEEYNSVRFIKWGSKNINKCFDFRELIFLLILQFLYLQNSVVNNYAFFFILFLVSVVWYAKIKRNLENQRSLIKPLVFTNRMIRIIVVYILSLLMILYLVQVKTLIEETSFKIFLINLSILITISQLNFLIVILSNQILTPIEFALKKYYIHSARKILNNYQPFVIGITGSYGKTTTKEITYHLLSESFPTLKTPKSYNTLMGICKVIRSELKPYHKYFVVEMGAYKKNEIKEICKLVNPKIGVITAIGPQHLERFKTIENIKQAKYELIESLPENGIAIFNGNDENCFNLSILPRKQKTLRYFLGSNTNMDLNASSIELSQIGTIFSISDNKSIVINNVLTNLLGSHNISNILASILVARECGLSIQKSVNSLKTMEAFEHRLQIRKYKDVIILDDSYNSNPIGANEALNVINEYTKNRKILITPGFAELGSIKENAHFEFGFRAGKICDLIFLIGREENTTQIAKGVQESGFDTKNLFFYKSLKEAMENFNKKSKIGDIVLLENDLSDNYL